MGSRFAKYELVRSLGRGGMAEAWLATSRGAAGVSRPVVIKKVLPQYAGHDELIDAFISEARISTTLSHGNIAQVFEFGEVDGQFFLAMEFVNGRSLAHVLRRAAKKGYWHLPVPLAAFVAAEMLKGLHHAHTRRGDDGQLLNVVHRDVTPDNVLLSFEGEVKVADFGIAKARLAGRRETEVGVVKGKFLYFSPEQATGKKVDARTDVYAVGACLYEMLTGRLPFEGAYLEVMPLLVAGQKRPVRELNPLVPEALEDIVDRAMAKDLTARYRSAQQMLEALTAFLSANAPSFSGERLALLLHHLYQQELTAEGTPPRFSAASRAQLEAWRPHRPPPGEAGAASPTDTTTAELPPLTDEDDGGRGARVAVIAAVGLLALATAGAAVWLLTPAPSAVDAPEPISAPPVALAPPPRPRPAPVPPAEATAPPAATADDSRHRRVELLAGSHVVSRRPGRSQSKTLDPQQTWRLSLTQPEPLLATVILEFEDVAGRVEQAPLGRGETFQVRGKRSVGVRCEPGPSTPREGTATLELTPAVGRAARLAVDPRLCLDFERARGLELDHQRDYRLALPDAGDASLGEGAPVQVAWRARQTDGAFTSGTLKPGATVSLSGAVFLEVGFFDDAPRDNHGAATVTLDAADAPPP